MKNKSDFYIYLHGITAIGSVAWIMMIIAGVLRRDVWLIGIGLFFTIYIIVAAVKIHLLVKDVHESN